MNRLIAVLYLAAGSAFAVLPVAAQTVGNEWSAEVCAPVPMTADPAGSALIGVGNGADLYALIASPASPSDDRFYRYSIAGNDWHRRTDPARYLGEGASLAYDGGGFIYAAFGGGLPYFGRCSIVGPDANPWEMMAPVPGNMSMGGQIVFAGDNRIVAITGGYSATLHVYLLPDADFPEGRWVTPAESPGWGFGYAAAMTFPGSGDDVYLFQGIGQSQGQGDRLLRLSISTGQPVPLAELPVNAGPGASLLHLPWRNQLLAFRGDGTPTFWAYSIGSDLWEARADAPGSPRFAQSLAYPGGTGDYLYALPGGSAAFWRYRIPDALPTLTTPAQLKIDGVTPLAPGQASHEGAVIVAADLGDSDDDTLRLDVEVKPVEVPFTGTPTATGHAYRSGAFRATLTISGLAEGVSYHWQARASDSRGKASDWVGFGANLDEADFSMQPNHRPETVQVRQIGRPDGIVVSIGASLMGSGIRFEAPVTDPDDDPVRLEIEVRSVNAPFTGSPRVASPLTPSGGTASVIMDLPPGSYRWRFRIVDYLNATKDWASFGGNAEEGADFTLWSGGSSNSVSCLHSAALPPGSSSIALFLVILIIVGRGPAHR